MTIREVGNRPAAPKGNYGTYQEGMTLWEHFFGIALGAVLVGTPNPLAYVKVAALIADEAIKVIAVRQEKGPEESPGPLSSSDH